MNRTSTFSVVLAYVDDDAGVCRLLELNGGGGGKLKSTKLSNCTSLPRGKISLLMSAFMNLPVSGELHGGSGRGELENVPNQVDWCGELGSVSGSLSYAFGGELELKESDSRDSGRRCDICVGTTVLICDGRRAGGEDGASVFSRCIGSLDS